MDKPTIALGIFLLFTGWLFSAVPGNYYRAKSTGLPVYIILANPASPFWIILVAILGWSGLEKSLPSAVFERIKIAIHGWEFRCRHSVHTKLGSAFVAVTTGPNVIVSADPDLGFAVLSRRKDFVRAPVSSKILGRFGPNIFSEDNESWQRHRRIVAPVLNERIMNTVWMESTEQAKQMLQAFAAESAAVVGKQVSAGETDGTLTGLKTITVNVIASASFGTKIAWNDSAIEQQAPSGYQMTLVKGLATIVNNFFLAILLPPGLMLFPLMPKNVRSIGTAATEFPRHAGDIIAEERRAGKPSNTLVNALVRIADQDQSQTARLSKTSTYLSEEEIAGNLFIFTLAGFDTTANTLSYAIIFLALHPEWQDWIIAGIDQAAQADPENDYESSFPLLNRIRAVMFETLRLCTPIPHIARIAGEDLTVGSTRIPKDTLIQVSSAVIHSSPDLYGPDPSEFRPARWCTGPSKEGHAACETLYDPPNGTFMPWSAGPRFCPGIKMSQVEFVGVIREIFSKFRVEPAKRAGESPEGARTRLRDILMDSSPKLTLQVKKETDVVLRWTPR